MVFPQFEPVLDVPDDHNPQNPFGLLANGLGELRVCNPGHFDIKTVDQCFHFLQPDDHNPQNPFGFS